MPKQEMVLLDVSKIKDNPINREIFYDLDPKKYEALKEYIKKKGILKPLVLNNDYELLAGHQRIRIARELGIKKVKVIILNLDREEQVEYLINDNVLTRTLTPSEIAKGGMVLERMHGKYRRGKNIGDIISKNLGVSNWHYIKCKKLLLSGDERLLSRIDSGKLSVNKAFQLLDDKIRKEQIKKLKEQQASIQWLAWASVTDILNFKPHFCSAVFVDMKIMDSYEWLTELDRISKDTCSVFVACNENNMMEIVEVLNNHFTLNKLIYIITAKAEKYSNNIILWVSKRKKAASTIDSIPDYYDMRKNIGVFPDKLYETLIQKTTSKGDVVLNIFAGKGEVLDICKVNERNVYAIEDSHSFFNAYNSIHGSTISQAPNPNGPAA
jgi:ParB-like chromosome segregation protein Spo0J